MTEEPYRWLEAINNRREYIEDQLSTGRPVAALSCDAGILMVGERSSTPKLFEIYDHLALATLGHPADIEKVRQAAIDAAHLEGFARSSNDVTARRLVSYNLSPALKNAFEQIFSAPLLFRGLLAELGATAADDVIWRLEYDGTFVAQSGPDLARGSVINGPRSTADEWLNLQPAPELPRGDLKAAAFSLLRMLAWAKSRRAGSEALTWADVPAELPALREKLGPEPLEFAFLDRSLAGEVIRYRVPSPAELGL
jgi:proteasome alpha subunit